MSTIGKTIAEKRRALGLTQQNLADMLHVSFQAVSKWENGISCPDVLLIPKLAAALGTTSDALLGYAAPPITDYERKYCADGFYWGLKPNDLCYEIMRRKPPVKPWRVLDIGCGEGKDAVFLARNGYAVTALDAAESGLEKARRLAEENNVRVELFRADMNDYRVEREFDIIFSSGVFHYLLPENRADFTASLKAHTAGNGINVINVFAEKPFIVPPPDHDSESTGRGWKSGELFTYYYDWLFHRMEEVIFDCSSSGIPHKHCMDIMVAEKI